MKRSAIAFAILLSTCTLTSRALGESQLPDAAKESFLHGVARLKERKKDIFNAETLPGLKPIKDVQITADLKTVDSIHHWQGVVRVTIRVTKDSGHLKTFWLSFRDGRWILTDSTRSPWESTHPPKVEIREPLTQPIQEKVQVCFTPP